MKRKVCRAVIAVVMATVLAFTGVMSVSAAPSRKNGNVKYLSDVVLIEAKDQTEADALLTELKKEENGAYEGMIALDLNAGGSKQMYLVYKTSTNVDDAITDLSVMNMNGAFTMGNYEQLYNKTLEGYVSIANDYRTMALEFKANYDAGEFGALAAYRQMNYYYLEENGKKTYMGDYMLNFPENAEAFARILFSGNLNIVTNLRALMAMGVGDPDATLADRIAMAYRMAKNDDAIYSNPAYEKTAKALQEQLEELKKKLNNLPLELAELEKNTEMDADTKAAHKQLLQENLDTATAFYELLKDVPMNDTTLGDYMMTAAVIEASKLNPVVVAATPAEELMMQYHSFYSLLLYDVLEMGETALSESLAELEKEYEPISVYYGVQNDLAEGSIGVTQNAELSASTGGGNVIDGQDGDSYYALKCIGFEVLGAAGLAGVVGGSLYLGLEKASISVNYASVKAAFEAAQVKVGTLQNALNTANRHAGYLTSQGASSALLNEAGYTSKISSLTDQLTSATQELEKAQTTLNSTQSSLTGAQIAGGVFSIALGAVMMGVSIWQLTKLYNQYDISYTEIPDNMVHVVNRKNYGDRFINYKNVPAYYYDNNKTLQQRENDLNAYKGRQWVSLYYTKNYEAGYCLTATPDLIATEAARSGYSGIHMFGYTSNYNLNAYCNRENAQAVYLAFKYSTNKKSAETDVPDVVGTIVSYGGYAFTGVAGIALGMCLMTIVAKKKKKKVAAAADEA